LIRISLVSGANAANSALTTYRPFRGIAIANEPFTSVVVAYFFPVNVFVAVTLTPGSGIAPAFTVPVIVPPVASVAGTSGAGID
jgi:hypothetical protein